MISTAALIKLRQSPNFFGRYGEPISNAGGHWMLQVAASLSSKLGPSRRFRIYGSLTIQT